MAKSKDDQGRPLISRSPRQASRIFGLDQDWFLGGSNGNVSAPPRPRFLFVVRFIRGAGEGNAKWKDGLSFAVKSFSRPKVTPKIQELNQYNKKRLVQTGVQYSPVNIEFYDTVDAVVSHMWGEYASYYFGDFRRQSDYDWKYDVTGPEFKNTSSQGFGFTLPPAAREEDTEAGFFFERVECYQFFGGQYTQFDLVHPRISSFDPDEMDYEHVGSHGIRMALEYESIIYHKNNVPENINDNEELVALFGAQLNGDVYDPPGAAQRNAFASTNQTLGAVNDLAKGIGSLFGNKKLASTGIIPEKVTQKLGVLGSFGSFDFGAGVDKLLYPVTGPLNRIAGTDFASLGKGANGASGTSNSGGSGLNASLMDVATGKAQKLLGPGAASQPGLAAAIAKSDLTGDNFLGSLNASRPSSSQVGFRSSPPEEPPLG